MAERRPAVGSDADLVTLRTAEQLDAAANLLWSIWGARNGVERSEVISNSMLRTLAHSGNYVVGAYRGDELIGCTVGMFGSASGRPDHLHSYIAGVPQAQSNRGVGYAMKRHQRQWALERGIGTIKWTFDPMVAGNAYFNLCKLGVTVMSFEPDFYGRLDDGYNTDQSTDRLLVEWNLRAEWVEQAMTGDRGGFRRHISVVPEAELIPVPEDIGKLLERDPQLAQQERLVVRQRFQSLITQGYQVVGMSKAREYVLLAGGVEPRYEA